MIAPNTHQVYAIREQAIEGEAVGAWWEIAPEQVAAAEELGFEVGVVSKSLVLPAKGRLFDVEAGLGVEVGTDAQMDLLRRAAEALTEHALGSVEARRRVQPLLDEINVCVNGGVA